MNDDLLFIFTPPPTKRPKPLSERSDDEILDYVTQMEFLDTITHERNIEKLVQTCYERWLFGRDHWPNPAFRFMQFAAHGVSASLPEGAVKPESPVTFEGHAIRLPPPFLLPEQAKFVIERLVREKYGSDHLPH